jgi:hypothetical protein
MQLKIDISLNGDHMQEVAPPRAADVTVNHVWSVLEAVTLRSTGAVLDVNGNTIGTWRVTR